ncbi:MAG: hypothetical protein R3F65_11585 [bacterium]
MAIARHLGLGSEHWPVSPGDEEVRRAVEAAIAWHPLPTLSGEEWCPLLTDLRVARAFHAHASKFEADVALLAFGLTECHPSLGWDLGTPAGGHSVIPHEVVLPAFAREAASWLNSERLFGSREAALAFWDVRQRLCSEHPEWEEPSGWAIVHVARLDIKLGTD